MMQNLKIILISLLVIVVVLNLPTAWFSVTKYFNKNLGTSVTEIAVTTNLADYPAIQNTNVNNLNAGKIEVSTTTLPLLTTLTGLVTVGTIGTGVWEGTEISAIKGGTGLTSYATGDILFASASNVLSKLTASSTNEVLTLVGGVPVWRDTVINVASAFDWTGLNSWSNTSTFNGVVDIEADAGAKLTLNTVAYEFPSSDGNANTVLSTSGAGVLSWASMSQLATSTHSGFSVFSSTASTTVFTFPIPANTLGTNGAVHVKIPFSDLKVGSTAGVIFIELNYGGSKQNMFLANTNGGDAVFNAVMDIVLLASNATGAQESTITVQGSPSGITFNSVGTDATLSFVESATHTVDSTSAQTFSLILRNFENEAQTGFTIDNIIGEYIK